MARGAPPAGWRRDVAAGRLAPAYLLYGEESFLKEEAVAGIRAAALAGASGADAAWNLTVFEAPSAGLDEILDAARTLPMLGERRLVLVQEVERIREADPAALRAYLRRPSPTSCVVFVSGAGRPDFRKGVFRALQELSVAVEFRPVRGASLTRWIRERASGKGVEIDDEAVALLELHAAGDLLRIDRELDKAAEMVRPARRIRTPDLAESLGTPAAGSVFELAERTGAGETAEAVRLLRGILSEGEDEAGILTALARHFRILVLGKALVRARRSDADLASALGIRPIPFVIEKTRRLIGRFPDRAGEPAIQRLVEADRAVKSGAGKTAALERCVIELSLLVSREAAASGRRPPAGA
jgi:DNA polymerase-3 subunit delta